MLDNCGYTKYNYYSIAKKRQKNGNIQSLTKKGSLYLPENGFQPNIISV